MLVNGKRSFTGKPRPLVTVTCERLSSYPGQVWPRLKPRVHAGNNTSTKEQWNEETLLSALLTVAFPSFVSSSRPPRLRPREERGRR